MARLEEIDKNTLKVGDTKSDDDIIKISGILKELCKEIEEE